MELSFGRGGGKRRGRSVCDRGEERKVGGDGCGREESEERMEGSEKDLDCGTWEGLKLRLGRC